MFDRGLLSLTDGYEILMVNKLIPDPIKRLLNPDGKLYFLQIEGCAHIRSSYNIIANESSKAEDSQEHGTHL